jgi:hypothetical protein
VLNQQLLDELLALRQRDLDVRSRLLQEGTLPRSRSGRP